MNALLIKRAVVGTTIGLMLATLPAIALAQTPNNFGNTTPNNAGGSTVFPNNAGGSGSAVNTGTGPANCGSGPCAVTNPLGGTTSLCGLLKNIFQAVVAIAIPIAVLFIIWSGFQFVLAQGNPKKLATARRNFYYTVIGIAIFLGAWLIATVVASTINALGGSSIISCN